MTVQKTSVSTILHVQKKRHISNDNSERTANAETILHAKKTAYFQPLKRCQKLTLKIKKLDELDAIRGNTQNLTKPYIENKIFERIERHKGISIKTFARFARNKRASIKILQYISNIFRYISVFNDTTQEVKPVVIKIIEPLNKDGDEIIL